MAECINDLAGDILQDCNTVYGVGVEKIAYLIKKSDLDESATTYTKPKITRRSRTRTGSLSTRTRRRVRTAARRSV